MKKYLILCVIMFLAACARKAPEISIPSESALAPWERMQEIRADGPYRIQFSMRFGEEGDTRRVTGVLWSNGAMPLRIDVMAGTGTTVAKIAEHSEEFLMYVPREGKAYYHEGATKPLFNIGIPLPLNIGQLAGLLSGRYAMVFGAQPNNATPDGDLVNYALDDPPGGNVTLDKNGLPLAWDLGNWKLQFAYGEEWPTLPKSLRLENNNGKFALLLVKEREKTDAPFEEEQFALELPPGTPRLPVGQFQK